jgi:hypothetical protein
MIWWCSDSGLEGNGINGVRVNLIINLVVAPFTFSSKTYFTLTPIIRKEYIRWRKQIDAIQHFGPIDFEPEFLAEMDRRSQLR